jgi:hypothetical protein
MKDMSESILRVPLKSPIDAVRTDWKSKYIDLKGFEGCTIELELGAFAGEDGSNYLTPELEEYDPTSGDGTPGTATNYSAVAAADMVGSFVAINASGRTNRIYAVGYKGKKRYLYLKGTYTSSGVSAGIVGVSAVLSLPHSAPIVITPTTGEVS